MAVFAWVLLLKHTHSHYRYEPPSLYHDGVVVWVGFQQSPYSLVCVRAGITGLGPVGPVGPVGPGWSGNKLQLKYNTTRYILFEYFYLLAPLANTSLGAFLSLLRDTERAHRRANKARMRISQGVNSYVHQMVSAVTDQCFRDTDRVRSLIRDVESKGLLHGSPH